MKRILFGTSDFIIKLNKIRNYSYVNYFVIKSHSEIHKEIFFHNWHVFILLILMSFLINFEYSFILGDLTMQIIQGPIALVIGVLFGIIWGYLSRYLPERNDVNMYILWIYWTQYFTSIIQIYVYCYLISAFLQY